MEGLGIDLKSLIFQLFNFSVLVFVLTKLLYGPLIKVLNARRDAIKHSLTESERLKKELSEIRQKQDQILSQTHEQAKAILSKEADRAKVYYDESLKRAALDVEEIMSRGERSLQVQKEEFKAALKVEVAEMVKESVKKVLSEGLTEAEKEKLVAEALKKIS